ncbi:MAG: hypothetical protein ACP5R2_02645 [Anaerolineae bacterium]
MTPNATFGSSAEWQCIIFLVGIIIGILIGASILRPPMFFR